MTSKYFVEIKPHFDHSHLVHKKGCPLMPLERKCIFLGHFMDGNYAVFEGLKYFHSVKACLFCTTEKPVWHKNALEVDMLVVRN